MKQIKWIIVVFAISLTGCASDRQKSDSDSVPFIDIRKNYTEKEIVLTDIADVTYVHLNSKDEDFLYKGGINYVTGNMIIVGDWVSKSILFFSRDGNPKSRFNHHGQGPEEYYLPDVFNIIYDEEKDDVFIPMHFGKIIQVYSSTGEYKRKLTLPNGYGGFGLIIVSYDDQSLLMYDNQKTINKILRKSEGDHSAFSPQLNDSSFVLISKIDGRLLESVEVPSITTDLSVAEPGSIMQPGFTRISTCAEGFFLCNPENDTIYLYKKDKSLTPILRKIPLLSESAMFLLNSCLDAGKFQFMSVRQIIKEDRRLEPKTYYMRDKETGEVFRPKITLPDYKGKEFFIDAYGTSTRYLVNEYWFTLNLPELKQAYEENRLSGKLKELVATLNEDKDNDIFLFLRFK